MTSNGDVFPEVRSWLKIAVCNWVKFTNHDTTKWGQLKERIWGIEIRPNKDLVYFRGLRLVHDLCGSLTPWWGLYELQPAAGDVDTAASAGDQRHPWHTSHRQMLVTDHSALYTLNNSVTSAPRGNYILWVFLKVWLKQRTPDLLPIIFVFQRMISWIKKEIVLFDIWIIILENWLV